MRRLPVLLLVLFTASIALASPVITSITPAAGPTTGGTTVVIKGTGFSNNCPICSPPFITPSVYFGGNASPTVSYIDAQTIQAVTPQHLPGNVDVVVVQFDDSATRENGFLYTGELEETFDRILFPIFMPPVHGAFGSEFHTIARIYNQGQSVVVFFGTDTNCSLADPPTLPDYPFPLGADQPEREMFTLCSTSTGRLFYVPKGSGKSLAANLRVVDVSRQAESQGVEIPVVRDEDFRTEHLSLLNVPVDPKFRNTLRIYALKPGFVNVSINNLVYPIPLTAGENRFEPWFASFSDFPTKGQLPGNPSSVHIDIDTPLGSDMPFWAFVSSTNNVTQEITVVTPN